MAACVVVGARRLDYLLFWLQLWTGERLEELKQYKRQSRGRTEREKKDRNKCVAKHRKRLYGADSCLSAHSPSLVRCPSLVRASPANCHCFDLNATNEYKTKPATPLDLSGWLAARRKRTHHSLFYSNSINLFKLQSY